MRADFRQRLLWFVTGIICGVIATIAVLERKSDRSSFLKGIAFGSDSERARWYELLQKEFGSEPNAGGHLLEQSDNGQIFSVETSGVKTIRVSLSGSQGFETETNNQTTHVRRYGRVDQRLSTTTLGVPPADHFRVFQIKREPGVLKYVDIPTSQILPLMANALNKTQSQPTQLMDDLRKGNDYKNRRVDGSEFGMMYVLPAASYYITWDNPPSGSSPVLKAARIVADCVITSGTSHNIGTTLPIAQTRE